jgi:phage shock protein E
MRQAFLIIPLVIGAFFLGKTLSNPSVCASCGIQVISSVNASEFKQRLSHKEVILLDIRTSEEFNQGHLASSINQDFYQTEKFKSYLQSLDKTKAYAIYCRTGNRSGDALKMMEDMGFSHVVNLDGGIQSWQNAGYSVVKK